MADGGANRSPWLRPTQLAFIAVALLIVVVLAWALFVWEPFSALDLGGNG